MTNIYKELDQKIRTVSMSEEEYEENKHITALHLNGELGLRELPEVLQQAIFDWEIEENERWGTEGHVDQGEPRDWNDKYIEF